mgnify:CR=1 FL=1
MSFQTTYGPDGRLRVAILGCTGSIGTQALDVCRQHADRLQVTALSVNSSTSELVAAAREFSVPAVAVADVAHGDDAVLQELPEGTQLGVGAQAVCELARRDDVDCVLVAIVGAAGLEASHAALTSNKRLALANKESLVVGGDLLMPLAQPGQLIPVDSEHSAIYQCYLGENPREAHCIWLTCSGGPFFGRTRDELDRVTRADALAHPTWAMGAKITIDSATLMNKGLERIEAMHLFNCDLDFINVVVQRQSKIHSMVEFADGSVMAHLGASDMRIPIQFAFSYPERWDTPAPRIDFRELGQLTFDAADMDTFRCLDLALKAARTGGTAGAILNGANEAAVALFLEDRIGFLEIADRVALALDRVPVIQEPSMTQILEADQAAREAVLSA